MKRHDPETFREQLERVQMMAEDDGTTWDLSENDQAALKAVLEQLGRYRGVVERLASSQGMTPFTFDDRFEKEYLARLELARRAFALSCGADETEVDHDLSEVRQDALRR